MTSPNDLRYTKTHEWIRVDGDVATIGLTDYAQQELGDITYVELPGAGAEFGQNEPFGVVESVKAVSDLFAPVSGSVASINDALSSSPELVNSDPYGDGWMIKIAVADASQFEELLDGAAYDDLVAAG
jgi:glycine cleavage system H protein